MTHQHSPTPLADLLPLKAVRRPDNDIELRTASKDWPILALVLDDSQHDPTAGVAEAADALVTAVNSHAALVAACESMLAALNEGCAARGFTANHEAKAALAGTGALALAKGAQ